MQAVSQALRDTINKSDRLTAVPKAIFEWNYNRFAAGVTVTEPRVEAGNVYEPKKFKLESIVAPNRGPSGTPKAFVDQAYVSDESTTTRWKVVGEQVNIHQYWVSENLSDPDDTYHLDGHAKPQVLYDKAYRVNKLRATIERSWAEPDSYTIFVTADGTNWTSVGSNFAVPTNGIIELYRQADGTWSTTRSESTAMLRGIRIEVYSMNKPESRFALRELALLLELDLSDDIISMDVTKARESVEVGTPMGVATTSTCNISLDNTDQRYNTENAASDLFGLISTNVKINTFIGIDTSAYGGAGVEYVPQGVFYVDTWGFGADAGEATVNGTDFSKYLQEYKLPPQFFAGMDAWQIMQEIIELIGVKTYTKSFSTKDTQPFRYVYFNDEITIWDALSEIARAEQSVFYFDETGAFRYASPESLYSQSVQLAITDEKAGDLQPNLITVEPQFTVQANKIDIVYKTLAAKKDKKGNHTNAILWKPEEPVVLQASTIRDDMDSTQDFIRIGADDARFWPYSGFINVEGEIMSYRGKQVSRRGENKVRFSADQHPKYVETGKLVNVERGLFGTQKRVHKTNIEDWEQKRFNRLGSGSSSSSPKLNPSGWLHMEMSSGADTNDYKVAFKERQGNWKAYGTSLRFSKSKVRHGIAGLVFNLQSNNKSGYYVQVALTSHVEGTSLAEIKGYRMYSDGHTESWPSNRGRNFLVLEGVEVQIDVWRSGDDWDVYINGMPAFTIEDNDPLDDGNAGVWVRGNTIADFNYFYEGTPDRDDHGPARETLFHRIEGSYVSGFPMKERLRNKRTDFYFEEFGPVAHEMREFDVKYETFPALDASVFLPNDTLADVYFHRHDPFGSYFILANTSRSQVVLEGADETSIPGEEIQQQMFVYGTPVIESEEKRHSVQHEPSIRRHGPIDFQLNNRWIQTKGQAQDVGEFLTTHWAEPVDVLTVNIIGTPALQVGDLVSVEHFEKNMTPSTHQYHIVDIAFSVSDGMDTRLTLRRARTIMN